MKKLIIPILAWLFLTIGSSVTLATPVEFPLYSFYANAQYGKAATITAVNAWVTDGTNIWAGSTHTISPIGGTNPIIDIKPNDYTIIIPDSRNVVRFTVTAPDSTNVVNLLSLITSGLSTYTNFVAAVFTATIATTNTATATIAGDGSSTNPIAVTVIGGGGSGTTYTFAPTNQPVGFLLTNASYVWYGTNTSLTSAQIAAANGVTNGQSSLVISNSTIRYTILPANNAVAISVAGDGGSTGIAIGTNNSIRLGASHNFTMTNGNISWTGVATGDLSGGTNINAANLVGNISTNNLTNAVALLGLGTGGTSTNLFISSVETNDLIVISNKLFLNYSNTNFLDATNVPTLNGNNVFTGTNTLNGSGVTNIPITSLSTNGMFYNVSNYVSGYIGLVGSVNGTNLFIPLLMTNHP